MRAFQIAAATHMGNSRARMFPLRCIPWRKTLIGNKQFLPVPASSFSIAVQRDRAPILMIRYDQYTIHKEQM